ncbi:Phenyloxazoline synthase MbtB [Micromonospora sp. MH33]|uniref:phosphopantetheine-binding protein n=1 Tax=Micromonospora sp. MH33 TaxID=1945509 RepID=UPI000D1486BF|nr:phosphopantetheine-binding protein [Micromonospora sp. MH33]PSK66035.1 Phenyloxazoline synthase MbtB [Micromonospora sp. MH33]
MSLSTAERPDDAGAVLAEIWSELLGIPAHTITPDASFLRLGGDSVLAVRMAALIRKRLGVVLALADVGAESTVAELTELIRRRSAGGTAARALPVELRRRLDKTAPFPLLPLQQGYFVGQQGGWELSYESAHFYSDVALLDMDSEEAPEALADALRRLAEHQPMLRARVTSDGMQHILPLDAPAAVPEPQVYDLRTASAEETAESLARLRAEMIANGPDPARGPGLDIRLTLLPDGRGRLHTNMSLLLFDGWSATLLNRELLELSADWNAMPAPLDMGFDDYVSSVHALPQTDAWTSDRDWWWSRLDDMPLPPALPLTTDPREVRATTMVNREQYLSPGRWVALRDRCAAHDVTPSTAMFTVFAITIARWAGHHRLLLNSLQLNRLPLHPDVHRVFGAFASTMLLPTELTPGSTFAQLVTQAQRRFTEHAGHALVTGVEVSRELGRRRGTHRPVAPVVFQSTLGMDAAMGAQQPDFAGPLGQLDMDDFFHQLRTPQVALEARFYELRGSLAIAFSLVEELFDIEQVDAAYADLVALVGSLADGDGWDRPVDLPGEPNEARTGLRLGRYDDDRADADGGPPATELELTIASVWEEVLEAPVLDRGANFFDLGGDSLLAVRALARLAKEAGITVPVREFLADPTVAGLAAASRTDVAR